MTWVRNRRLLLLLIVVAIVGAWLWLRASGLIGSIAPRDAIKEARAALDGPATRVEFDTTVEGPAGVMGLPVRFQGEGVIFASGANGSFTYDLSSIPNGGGALGQLNEFEVRLFDEDIYPDEKNWLHIAADELDAALRADLHLLRQMIIASPAYATSFLSDEGELSQHESELGTTYTSTVAVSDLEDDAHGFARLLLGALGDLGGRAVTAHVVLDDDLNPEHISFEIGYPVVEASQDDINVTVDLSIVEIGVGAGLSVPDPSTVTEFSELQPPISD